MKPSERGRGHRGASLSAVMLTTASMVEAVRAGRSLSETLQEVPLPLRPATQSLAFHVMRRLALALALRTALARRPPSDPRLDALVLVALALLDTALEHDGRGGDAARRDIPLYRPHTVVDQAVRASAAERRLRAAGGFVNALLRRYAQERDRLLPRLMVSEEVAWNHPQWWIDRLRHAFPQVWQDLLEAANRPGPLTLRVNAARARRPEVLEAFAQAGLSAQALDEDAIVLETPRPITGIPGYDAGWWSVQDASAQQAAHLLDPGAGMRVLDACAAPGGKTAHMLERAPGTTLLALDHDPQRLARVGDNLDRLGLAGPHVQLAQADAADLDAWWDGRAFDAVLADVPCTGSGVVRRHPDIRWLRRETDIARMASVQRDIVDALWTTVKPGGRLLYASCSLFPEEGIDQARSFLERHPDARSLPAPGQILTAPFPGCAGGPLYDGFFYALFAKQP